MKRKLHINPILRKEMMVGSRSIKMSMAVMGINLFLAFIVLIVIAVSNAGKSMSGYDYSSLGDLFLWLGIIECVLIGFIMPVLTAGSISGEREKQTLDIMLTTPVSAFSIALGKLLSSMLIVCMYMISSIPIMAIAFVLGGMSWWALVKFYLLILFLSFYLGSIGVFCSSIVKKSIMATILSFVIELGIVGVAFGTWMIGMAITNYHAMMGIGSTVSVSWEPLVLLFNPYVVFVDFFIKTFSGSNLCQVFKEMGTMSTGWSMLYNQWTLVSLALNILVALGFLKLAARKIVVVKNRKKKK